MARALEVVGERWTLLIVRDAFYGVRRFNDFQAHLDIPKAVLAERLRGLAEDGVLERHADPEHRGRHLYVLSDAGRALWPVVYSLTVWGDQHRSPNTQMFQHLDCGTELDDSGFCTACRMRPEPGDILTAPQLRSVSSRRRQDPVAIALRAPHQLLEPLKT